MGWESAVVQCSSAAGMRPGMRLAIRASYSGTTAAPAPVLLLLRYCCYLRYYYHYQRSWCVLRRCGVRPQFYDTNGDGKIDMDELTELEAGSMEVRICRPPGEASLPYLQDRRG